MISLGVVVTRTDVLKRLPENFQNIPLKLGELVQKEQAMMGQAYFAGARYCAPADQARVRNCMVWSAKRTGTNQTHAWLEHSGNAVDLGRLDSLIERQRRQDGGNALREHGLSRSRRPDHQDIVSSRGGHFDGALGVELALDVAEVNLVL